MTGAVATAPVLTDEAEDIEALWDVFVALAAGI
jgi:hypothetical protein